MAPKTVGTSRPGGVEDAGDPAHDVSAHSSTARVVAYHDRPPERRGRWSLADPLRHPQIIGGGRVRQALVTGTDARTANQTSRRWEAGILARLGELAHRPAVVGVLTDAALGTVPEAVEDGPALVTP